MSNSRIRELDRKNTDLLSALTFLVDAIEREPKDKCDFRPTKDSYRFIPLNIHSFMGAMETVVTHMKKRRVFDRDIPNRPPRGYPTFMDAGCGCGTKLVLATSFGFESYGLEIDRKLVRRAKRLFSANISGDDHHFLSNRHGHMRLPQVITKNVLNWDYSSYDVVFFYRPFEDREKEETFETLVYRQLAKGSYVIPVYRALNPPGRFKHLMGDVFYNPK